MQKNNIRIIVIGTSAGGMQALCHLISLLPADLSVAIFIVQHLSVDSSAPFLVNRLSRFTDLTCKCRRQKLAKATRGGPLCRKNELKK